MVEASIQALNHLRLHLSKFYYAVSSALSDNKLDAELQKIDMTLTKPVWVLGERFVANDPVAEEQVRPFFDCNLNLTPLSFPPSSLLTPSPPFQFIKHRPYQISS
jgi:hypothetical protein